MGVMHKKILYRKREHKMNAKKLFSALVVAAMMLNLVFVSASAAEASDTSWYDASKTEFTISTAAELKGLAELVNGGTNFLKKTVKLGADIDLENEEWTPIGNKSKRFDGTFDGNNKTISNLTITGTSSYVALFGNAGAGDYSATIKNLTLNNASVSGDSYVGGIAAEGVGKITNCNVTGAINLVGKNRYVGAVTGHGYWSISDCNVVAEPGAGLIKATYFVGGINGFTGEGSMKITKNTVANVSIEGVYLMGGITGSIQDGPTVSENKIENVTIKSRRGSADYTGLFVGQNAGDNVTTYVINNTAKNSTAVDNETLVITRHTGSHAVNMTVVGTSVRMNDAGKITSGKFELAPPDANLAEGARLIDNEDGTFTVTSEKEVNKIDISNEVLEKNDIVVEENTYVRGEQITVNEVTGRTLKADYQFTHATKAPIDYSLTFDISNLELSSANFGIVLYNIPNDWTVGAPTVTIE